MAPVQLAYADLPKAAPWAAPFPSLVFARDGVEAHGDFAQALAAFLTPDAQVVERLDALLRAKQMGIVAHYYMDPQLQGVLTALTWPHVFIADSLAMGEAAAKMAAQGVKCVAVLGVDFMAESVRANLDSNGFTSIPVYRLCEQKIGCSLAESAQQPEYQAWLQHAVETPKSLHVVYINTSLRSKAHAHDIVPTITCTSSNVVKTVLQAFAQMPDLHVWYGPDTNMGANLHQLFESMTHLPDEEIQKVHPAHTKETIKSLLPRFEYYHAGACQVHVLFDEKVAQRMQTDYADAFITAHLEVPTPLFTLAMAASKQGRGVVGSTTNILDFIKLKTTEAVQAKSTACLRFLLGTEAGLITAVAKGLRGILAKGEAGKTPKVEILFPVASTEGGGCATCPYMKLNDMEELLTVAEGASSAVSDADPLRKLYPAQYTELIGSQTVSTIGVRPILHMKHFQQTKVLSDELVKDINTRKPGMGCPEGRA